MDYNLRSLINSSTGENGSVKCLNEAYGILKSLVSNVQPNEPFPVGYDVFVLLTEAAIDHNNIEVAKECLRIYFSMNPPNNQFLGRAFLSQAKLLRPKNSENSEDLSKPVAYIYKAIQFAKEDSRYHFMVYNASVVYFELVRPYLKPTFKQHLAVSLTKVVKALDDIDDKDYEWRAQLWKILLECYLDGNHKKEAQALADNAANFITKNVPHLFKDIFSLIVLNNLGDHGKLQWWMKGYPELTIYHRIIKLRMAIKEKDPEVIVPAEIAKILKLLQGDAVQLGIVNPKAKKMMSEAKPLLLLELGRLALENGFIDITKQSIASIFNSSIEKDPCFYTEVEFLSCEVVLKQLGGKEEAYSKPVIDLRLQSINRCHEALLNAVRQGNPNTIQVGASTQWNLCLPLLQSDLRHHVRKPLKLVAQALEDIDSLLFPLRCQIHMELANCEADEEQIPVALEHLRKAIQFDDYNEYRESICVFIKRLQLRAELYKEPERPEDRAAQILEQARSTVKAATVRMKRALLMGAGHELAPDAFKNVLDAESDTKETSSKGPLTKVQQLASKARQYQTAISKCSGHLKRLGSENDRERARLWADLAKTARRQEVWDVCRIACRFCLLYDDGRWKAPPQTITSESPVRRSKSNRQTEARQSESVQDSYNAEQISTTTAPPAGEISPGGAGGSKLRREQNYPDNDLERTPERFVKPSIYEKELVRLLAEIHFINAESHMHLVRSENAQLYEAPLPPKNTQKRPKGYVEKPIDNDPDWLFYCEWLRGLCDYALGSFVRSAVLGVELSEPWLVSCSAAYVWNYGHPVLKRGQHHQLINTFSGIIECIKKVGHDQQTEMLVQICTALAYGLLQRWLPPLPQIYSNRVENDASNASTAGAAADSAMSAKKKPGSAIKSKSSEKLVVQIDPEGQADIKRAAEIANYALEITNGIRSSDIVPIDVRYPLLQVWVAAKQMLQQSIGKNFGAAEEVENQEPSPQRGMTRAMTATEMLWLSRNGVMEFKEAPSITDTAGMIEECQWTDRLVELHLWTRLAYLAFEMQDHSQVMRCSQKALELGDTGTSQLEHAVESQKEYRFSAEQELLSYVASIRGQSLLATMQGKNSIRRQAMLCFLNSVGFAKNASNYEFVSTAARHYWNACLPLLDQPIERELLREPLNIILSALSSTVDRKRLKYFFERAADEDDEKDEALRKREAEEDLVASMSQQTVYGLFPPSVRISPSKESLAVDLELRANMYGVLFDALADQGNWDDALKSMDEAIKDMPRTKHRLLLFKHRVLTRAKLGQSVLMDIQKFKDESEDKQAELWRMVALCSKTTEAQLEAYIKAIECLEMPENNWQKVEYLLEFSQWLYCNDFPFTDCACQIDWAIDILLNMRFPSEEIKEEDKKQKKKPPGTTTTKQVPKSSVTSAASRKENIDKVEEKKDIPNVEVPLYIPKEKNVTIGVPVTAPLLAINELQNIRQLDALLRSYSLQCMILGTSHSAHKDTLALAYSCSLQMWKLSLSAAGLLMKELAKSKAENESKAKKVAGGKKDSKDQGKEKMKRKGPLDTCPSSLEDWSTYDAPEELFEAFAQFDVIKGRGMGANNIVKPIMTLYYAKHLVTAMREVGYNHLVFPLLAIEDLLTRDILANRPANVLVHLTGLDVCLELNLLQGVKFHEHIIGSVRLNSEEQARQRQEIAAWKEKQAQVRKEEERARASLIRLGKEFNRDGTKAEKILDKSSAPLPGSHIGRAITSLPYYKSWAESAKLLIDQGQFQPAREFLDEAYGAARDLEDDETMTVCMLQLARLAFNEKQFGQAVQCARQAQKLSQHAGDETFWFETSMIIVDSLAAELDVKDSIQLARKELVNTINAFRTLFKTRRNKENLLNIILARMEQRLGNLQAEIGRQRFLDKMCESHRSEAAILSASDKLQSAANRLLAEGQVVEAAESFRDALRCLENISLCQPDVEKLKRHYLSAVTAGNAAVQITQRSLRDAQLCVQLADMYAVSLPLQRLCAHMKLELSRILLVMFEIHVEQSRSDRLRQEAKDELVRAVEDYTRSTPALDDYERKWLEVTRGAVDNVFNQLADAHNLANGMPEIRAQVLLLTGRALRLQASFISPDPPMQWDIHDFEARLLKMNLDMPTEGAASTQDMTLVPESISVMNDDLSQIVEESNPSAEIVVSSSTKVNKLTQSIIRADLDLQMSHRFFAQASEVSLQAVSLALEKDYLNIASDATMELLEILGQYDSMMSSQILALHQSCAQSLRMRQILSAAQRDPVQSKQAALINQIDRLKRGDLWSNASNGPVMRVALNTLHKTCLAWRMTSVSNVQSHFELIKEMPTFFNILLLQHSPCRRYLYGCVFDKARASGKNRGLTTVSNHTRVIRLNCSPLKVDNLTASWKQFRTDTRTILLKHENQRKQLAKQQKMLASISSTNIMADKENTVPESLQLAIDYDLELLQQQFNTLIAQLVEYLKPVLSQLQSVCQRPTTSASNSTSNKKVPVGEVAAAPTSQLENQEYLILLLDMILADFSIEAVPQIYNNETFFSVTRDFSTQILSYRLNKFAASNPDVNEEEQSRDKKKMDKNKPLSRIPGLRDASKKQSKIIPLNRSVPAGFMELDTSHFRYIVDPNLECAETEDFPPIACFTRIIETPERIQQFTPRWLGLTGNDHSPSVGEYEIYLKEGTALLYYGMERLAAQLPPSKIATLSLADCGLVGIFDRAQTSRSFSRQSKIDVVKIQKDIQLERATETAVLLTIAGVKCVWLNQWASTLQDNANKLEATMAAILEGGCSSGQAIRFLHAPHRRLQQEQEENGDNDVAPGVVQDAASENQIDMTDSITHSAEVAVELIPRRHWFNMVGYGLPNLIVTLIDR